MDSDDIAYRKSVRNMVLVLAAIVITIFAAIFIPPYVNPPHTTFPQSVSFDSGVGFSMHLTINYSSGPSAWSVLLDGWVNSTSPSIENVTAADSWAFPPNGFFTRPCTPGWPTGIGVMEGHYTEDNYTLGTLLPMNLSQPQCTGTSYSPTSFVFEPQTSKALVVLGGTPTFWSIQTVLNFTETAPGYLLPPGVYTAVLADEWGDVLTANFYAT
ncbi:MAG TPA: hypothetical protein VEJ19_02060 [Nitrososphaerales archaeon]|nr:hypothetical protein [Nitrososphaerales archaeon]